MCSQYGITTTKKDIEYFEIKVEGVEQINLRIFPYTVAPVIVDDTKLKLVGMQYSLVPSWSKEPKMKFATYNTRIETVLEKPTWKIPFKKQHCLVPLTGFFESVHDGPFAGNVIEFKPKTEKILFAAGIFDVWTNPETNKQLHSFSILTTEPSKFIMDNGHDRSPIFFNFENGKKWLKLINKDTELVDFLKSNLAYPELEITIDRPLKAGWDKK